MKKETYDEAFEQLWLENKRRLLQEDEEYTRAVEAYKMKSGADWLLFGIPVVGGIVSMEYIPISHELLRWAASIGITVLLFAVAVMVKSLASPHRAIEDIERDVKKRFYDKETASKGAGRLSKNRPRT